MLCFLVFSPFYGLSSGGCWAGAGLEGAPGGVRINGCVLSLKALPEAKDRKTVIRLHVSWPCNLSLNLRLLTIDKATGK